MAKARSFLDIEVTDPYGNAAVGTHVHVRRRDGADFVPYLDEFDDSEAALPLSTDANGKTGVWLERGGYAWQATGEDDWHPWDSTPGADGSIDPDWIPAATVTTIVQQVPGEPGPKGDKGDKGDPGDPGADGADGAPGADGADGAPGADGADGAPGADGRSAYQVWLDAGHVGTVDDYLASLKGEKGDPGDPGVGGGGGAGGAPVFRRVSGVINSDGSIARGAGFTVVKNGTGDFTVTFPTPFAAVPNIEVTTERPNLAVAAISNAPAPTASAFRVILYQSWTATNDDAKVHFTATDAGDFTINSAQPTPAYDDEVTSQGQVIVPVDHDVASYDILIDGIVECGAEARWVGIFPNGTPGANSVGNYMRTNMVRWWTDGGAATGGQQAWFNERGFVVIALNYAADNVLLAKGRIRIKAGHARLADFEAGATSDDPANVNTALKALAVSRWANTTDPVNTLVFDFGGGTFSGRIKVEAS